MLILCHSDCICSAVAWWCDVKYRLRMNVFFMSVIYKERACS